MFNSAYFCNNYLYTYDVDGKMLKFPELFDKHADAVWYIEITDKAEYWFVIFQFRLPCPA